MDHVLPHVRVAENVTLDTFRNEIVPGNRPVLLKGVAAHWPAVRAGLTSPEAMVEYIKRFDQGKPVETILGRPDIEGKFFYNETLDGLNFAKRPEPIGDPVQRILRGRTRPGLAVRCSAPCDPRHTRSTAAPARSLAHDVRPLCFRPERRSGRTPAVRGAHDREMRQKIRLMLLGAIGRQAGLRPPSHGQAPAGPRRRN